MGLFGTLGDVTSEWSWEHLTAFATESKNEKRKLLNEELANGGRTALRFGGG